MAAIKIQPRNNSDRDFQINIESMDENGRGVGKYDNITVHLAKTLPGEKIRVSYQKDRPPRDRLQLQEILQPSPLRRTAPCSYFSVCGGCQLQHVDYSQQLIFKKGFLENMRNQYPALRPVKIHAVTGMEIPFNYRNKTQLPLQMKNNQVVYGLYRSGTHDLIPVEQCLIESREANLILKDIRDWLEKYHIPPYDELQGKGLIRYALIRKSQSNQQLMLVLIINGDKIPFKSELLEVLIGKYKNIKSIYFNKNTSSTNIILGKKNLLIWGESFIEESMAGLTFRIYPDTFFQVNILQTENILSKILNSGHLRKNQTVLDLYCGTGIMGLLAATRVRRVIGIDRSEKSITTARDNALQNRLNNITFFTAGLGKRLDQIISLEVKPDVVILDPPRSGLSPELVKNISELKPETIVYLSCNPKTFYKNLHEFHQQGYMTDNIFPFDMFPQTAHLECLSFLHKRT